MKGSSRMREPPTELLALTSLSKRHLSIAPVLANTMLKKAISRAGFLHLFGEGARRATTVDPGHSQLSQTLITKPFISSDSGFLEQSLNG